ncbi:hypothetical protein FRB94_004882 [Tulasnella sp. JGI-2019a]|nr:hypothetical protein FRB93_005817 [Tulasnella sp. JGI-2019a]KAG9001229.1 hypothetical protein FRB94_004882 [Tulasnella sp. JGI-2019a]
MAHNQFQQIIADRVLFYNYNADIWTTVAISQELIPARKDYVELSEDNNFWDVLEGGLFGEAIDGRVSPGYLLYSQWPHIQHLLMRGMAFSSILHLLGAESWI